MAPRSIAMALALVLVSATAAQAALYKSPIKTAVEQSIQESLAKILQDFGAVSNHFQGGAQQVASQAAASAQGIQQVVSSIATPLATTAVGVTQQLVNDYTNMAKFAANSVQNLGGQMLGSAAGLGQQVSAGYDQIAVVLDAYEAKYCTPASFTPSAKKPSKFTGPSFDLSFQSGSCLFNESVLINENRKQLTCVEPSITFTKSAANFTSKYKSAPEFSSKECKVEKVFGETLQRVLFVFDGQNPVDINAITATVLGEVKGLMGSLAGGLTHNAVASQMQQFMGGLASHVAGGLTH